MNFMVAVGLINVKGQKFLANRTVQVDPLTFSVSAAQNLAQLLATEVTNALIIACVASIQVTPPPTAPTNEPDKSNE